jgi:hypothetical protein
VVRHALVQRIVRAYDSYKQAEQLPLAIDSEPIPMVERERKPVLKQ